MNRKWLKLGLKALLTVAVVIFIFYVGYEQLKPSGELEVYFLDVGQGDSAVIKTPNGHYVLIDGGYPRYGDGAVKPFLDRRFVSGLDDIVVSHYHADHVGGLLEVMDSVKTDMLSMPDIPEDLRPKLHDDLRDKAAQKNIEVQYLSRGDNFDVKDETLEVNVLFPAPALFTAKSDQNDNSLVMKFSYHDVSFLFTGDATEKAEKAMLHDAALLKSTVIKVPHHGSKYSSSQAFLNVVRPEYAVISVGYNTYGHPHPDTLDRYTKMGTTAYRTDLNGVIKFIVNEFGIKKIDLLRE